MDPFLEPPAAEVGASAVAMAEQQLSIGPHDDRQQRRVGQQETCGGRSYDPIHRFLPSPCFHEFTSRLHG